MKVVITKAAPNQNKVKAGDTIEATGADLDEMQSKGFEYVTAAEHEANERARKQEERITKAREAVVDSAIAKAIGRGALLPQDEKTPTIRANALKMEAAEDGIGYTYIESLPVKAKGDDDLTKRKTSGSDDTKTQDIDVVKSSFRDTFKEWVSASEPFRKTIKQGGIIGGISGSEATMTKGVIEATAAAHKKGAVTNRLVEMIKAGANYSFEEIVKAADYVDPGAGNNLGTLNTDLLLAFNLGHLENQLAMLDDITTDISDTPVMYQQTALTRYIIVPGFQSKIAANPWAAATGQTVDVNVQMNQYIGVPLAWNQTYVGATTRNLPDEFKVPQMYSIGQAVIYYLVNNCINGNTRISNNGTSTSTIKPAAKPDGVTAGKPFNISNANLSTFVSALPSAMDLAQWPGGDENDTMETLLRWAWVHTTVYASATQDTNFILNQTLQRLSNKMNPNVLTTGLVNRLGNIILRKSQLVTDQNSLIADPGNASSQVVSSGVYTNATTLGIAGTRSGLIFTSRLPLDYTKQLGVQGGYAIEVVTSPKLGIKMAIVKFLDHAYETANMRATLMFGTAIGDERQLMLLNIK